MRIQKRWKPPYSRLEVIEIIREQVVDLGSQSAWAKRAGISEPYLSDVLSGKRNPGPKVLRCLKLVALEETSLTYVPQ